MELIKGTHPKAPKFAPQDYISNMPDNVLTSILDRLPLQDAVRTSILSTNWRFNWTMLTQLVFDDNFFEYLFGKEGGKNYGTIISRLLFRLKGPIAKFVLYIYDWSNLDDDDINRWILFLSKNGIKEVKFRKVDAPQLKLPTYLFSCLELKHLELYMCSIDPPSNFHGFPNLLRLKLKLVQFECRKICDLFTRLPLLEVLDMDFTYSAIEELKLVDIAKLTNLKSLSLNLTMCEFDNTMITNSVTIFELVGFLPKLQELHLCFPMPMSFIEDGDRKRTPTIFSCLKTLGLVAIDLASRSLFSFAFDTIRSSPNLQNLYIVANLSDVVSVPTIEIDCNTMAPLQLRNVRLILLNASENEVCLIKYLLACSPFLKEMIIMSREKVMLEKQLLKFYRASPVAEIVLHQLE